MDADSTPSPATRRAKAVLITGCSSGIGRATAQHLARNGFVVFATVRREEHAEELRQLREPDLVPVCPLDLTRLDAIPPVEQTVSTELGRRGLEGLFALIHNAGGGGVAPVELLDLEAFRTELQTRVLGAVALVQAFLPLLRRAGGRIVWITTPATIPTPYVASIHACDFAVNCVARTLEIELKRWKIPNVMIRCGGIRTERGLQTTVEVEEGLRTCRRDRAALYDEALRCWGSEMAAFDAKRTEAAAVARVVARALLAARPRRRYAVGHMATAAAVLELLPQRWVDTILKSRF
jgi:NAD(P)-dependent dehydrogenase (short-subunit alcohol dehydrogenase family)